MSTLTLDGPFGALKLNSASNKASRQPKKRIRKWMNAPRDELIQLRTAVAQLKYELQALRDDMPSREAKKDPMNVLWQRIAHRQLKEREHSVRENATLRSRLAEQIRTIKSLERLVLKHQDEETIASGPEKRLRSTAAKIRWNARLSKQSSISWYWTFEVLDGRVLPFDFHTTAEALWEFWTKKQGPPCKHGRPNELEVTDNTVRRFCDEGLFDIRQKINGRFRFKIVGRRFVEAERVVLTCILLMEPLELNGRPMSGVCIRTRVWNVIQPAVGVNTVEPLTCREVLQVSSLEVFDESDNLKDRQEVYSTLSSFIVSALQLKGDLNHQKLEDRLLSGISKLTIH
ncbi:hypothetical protein Poli38472_011677 [Pythium oligandrum]|uniref:Uncharacterized protein n=1 Tax=Pythium oligandrum TaxID=41045 RepID=A0A8K1C7J8_PYTOL|nr:hypothetical protein Poli38472_011677 [Pythium oligandrum]|eukprot:TMW58089.1 hypothetical protein Poli38472_011677 [Pythium oligandrum]